MDAAILLYKIQSMYFTDTDEIRSEMHVSFDDVISLNSELFQVELIEGFNAQTEAIDSLIEELIRKAKSPPSTPLAAATEFVI